MSAASSKDTGIVLNIQRFCSHDGPGILASVNKKFLFRETWPCEAVAETLLQPRIWRFSS